MQQFATVHALRDEIIGLMARHKMDQDYYVEMLDYTIDLFESQGLGTDYYGYHNINHELEVTYVVLLSAVHEHEAGDITDDDVRYLFVAALFHDFDPQKSVDKPHEENVVRFIAMDKKLRALLKEANMDLAIIMSLIHRTTYPWSGRLKEDAEEKIRQCFMGLKATQNSKERQDHYMRLGWYLSIIDRIAGYATGDFLKAMAMSKMNAHALGWHPSLIVQRAVAYFEQLINEESEMCQCVLHSLPKQMRKNFMSTVLQFMKLRRHEVQLHADYVYENLRVVPIIEKNTTRKKPEFVSTLLSLYDELPRPLQFSRETFKESVRDPETILNTMRVGDARGEIVGYAKGGPLERYELRSEIRDENYGLNNTVFLEPLALKMGYWGLRGGTEMRNMFTMQAHAKKFSYLTSFSLRHVIEKRADSFENAEFVTKFDPERWDYYRIKL